MRRAILIILDGLRRDMISERTTPHLYALSRRAEQFAAHRTVFPSCTRVVSASIATGCLPARHGLAGNTLVLNEGGRLFHHDAGKPNFLQHKRTVTGHSLHVPVLAERLKDDGGAIIFSNVSPGAAYAQDPDGYGHVYHRAGSFGPGRQPVAPEDALPVTPGIEGDTAMTRRFIEQVILTPAPPALGVIWMGEPDASQHYLPLGSPAHLAILRLADQNAGAILDALGALPDRDDVLLLVGSDHGHQTVTHVVDIDQQLVNAGLKASPGSDEVVVASNGTSALIYLHKDVADRTDAISHFLRSQPWAGQVFARPAFANIGVGTNTDLAFVVSMLASEAPNDYGVAGTSHTARRAGEKEDVPGAGQHGGLGRYEQMPFLMISGDGFFSGETRHDASSVIDLAPTILRHLNKNSVFVDGRSLQCEVISNGQY